MYKTVESENLNKNNDDDNNFCDYYRARTPSATIIVMQVL